MATAAKLGTAEPFRVASAGDLSQAVIPAGTPARLREPLARLGAIRALPKGSPSMPDTAALKRGRLATMLAFLMIGVVWGSWAPHIALVAERLDLSPGVLGLVLLTVASGTMVTMPIIGGLASRFGSGPVTRALAPLVALTLLLPALAPTLPLLILGGFLLGSLGGAMDVAMNAQGIAIEARMKRPIVATLHAYYSLGALLGAGGAALLLPILPYWGHVLFATGIVLGLSAPVVWGLLPGSFDRGAGSRDVAWPPRAAWGIGLLAFIALVSEGAVQDWSAVYLLHNLGTGGGIAALGFAAFSATMTLGRFTGDRLRARVEDGRMLVLSALVSAIGLGLSLLIPHPAAAILGLGLMGLGMSNMVPILFVAGARVPGLSPSAGIAAVATVGYTGFMTGPVVIGGVAEVTGLRGSLFLLVLGLLVVTAVAPRFVRAQPRESAATSASSSLTRSRGASST